MDQYPAVLGLLTLESTPFHALSDCALAHPEPVRGLLNRQALMLHDPHPFQHLSAPLIPGVSYPYLGPPLPLEGILVAVLCELAPFARPGVGRGQVSDREGVRQRARPPPTKYRKTNSMPVR